MTKAVRTYGEVRPVLNITFYGVRGSTPCSGEATRHFGGNTACVLIDVPGEAPIICDLGTGLSYLGRDLAATRCDGPFTATALLSHLHWDHIQGIPFFKPLFAPDTDLLILGPSQEGTTVAQQFDEHIGPPVFPVAIGDLPGTVRFRDVGDETIQVGSASIRSFSVPHVGPTRGYRIDCGEGSVAFICDHQQPPDGSLEPPDVVVDACQGVDVLIHDSQYSDEEFSQRSDWGHCTAGFALELAKRTGAKRLVLFHHDPAHDDDWVADQVCETQVMAGSSVEVLGAREGVTLISGD